MIYNMCCILVILYLHNVIINFTIIRKMFKRVCILCSTEEKGIFLTRFRVKTIYSKSV